MHGKLAIIPIISEVTSLVVSGREVTGVVGTDPGKIVRKWLIIG